MMDWSVSRAETFASEQGARITINIPSKTALLNSLAARLSAGDGFTVATLNVDHVVKLRRNRDFRAAYARHSHVVADGNPVVWLSRLAGQNLELVPGCELVDPVAALAAQLRVPVAFVGTTDAALADAAAELTTRYPELEIAARISPNMGFDPEGPDADEVIDGIAVSGARICFLALGAPRQEIFAIRATERLPNVGFLSIGAGLDFVAGTQIRAPALVRAVAAEWLWRLGTNPRRLAKRYGACLAILPDLVLTAVRSRRGMGT